MQLGGPRLDLACSALSALSSPDSLLRGSLLRKKAGRDMPWPRLRTLSAMSSLFIVAWGLGCAFVRSCCVAMALFSNSHRESVDVDTPVDIQKA